MYNLPKDIINNHYWLLFPRSYLMAEIADISLEQMILIYSQFDASLEDFDLHFRIALVACREHGISIADFADDLTLLIPFLPLRPADFIYRNYKKKEINTMTGQPDFFEPKGIYRVIFNEDGDKGNNRIAQGRIVNYSCGNIVLHNDETGELLITRFNNVVQVFRIKKEAPNGV